MKKKTVIFAMLAVLLLSGCGGKTADSSAESKTKIDVKGVFLLEPSESLDLSSEGLNAVQRYVFAVYDVDNSGNAENVELSPFNSSVKLTLNDTNTYEQSSSYRITMQNFIKSSGYALSTSYGTLWGGSEPVRMVAAFAVNGNDISDDCSAKLYFDLAQGTPVRYTDERSRTDIQTIAWPDGIFAVEDDPDAYQLIHSVQIRAQICRNALETASQANQNKNNEVRDLNLGIGKTIFSADANWGVSCACDVSGNALLDDLPRWNIETVRKYEPELAEQISTITDSLETMTSELAKASPNYDTINSAQRTAYNTLNTILQS